MYGQRSAGFGLDARHFGAVPYVGCKVSVLGKEGF